MTLSGFPATLLGIVALMCLTPTNRYSTLAEILSVNAYSKPPPAVKPGSNEELLVEVMTVLPKCPIVSVVLSVSSANPAVTNKSERSDSAAVPQRRRNVERNVACVVLVMTSRGLMTGILASDRAAEPPSQ